MLIAAFRLLIVTRRRCQASANYTPAIATYPLWRFGSRSPIFPSPSSPAWFRLSQLYASWLTLPLLLSRLCCFAALHLYLAASHPPFCVRYKTVCSLIGTVTNISDNNIDKCFCGW
jgi:hypothetical protein